MTKVILGALFLLAPSLHADYVVTADIPVLIGGTVVDPNLYPATVWIGNCTASVVGPRAVYTAAHCVGNSASFTVKGVRYSSSCQKSREYPRNPTSDFALCHTDKNVVGIEYENINLDPSHVTTGDWILQCGFGCTRWGTRLDGQLRVGRSQILQMPRGNNNDYVTGNGAVLCSGDSGGPAWSLDDKGERNRLISVNSRSNTTTRSYLSALATAEGIRFTNSVMENTGMSICGVTEGVEGCRNTKPKEPFVFTVEKNGVKGTFTVQPDAEFSAQDAQFAIHAVFDSWGEEG